jgi:hypothetical protein
VKKYCKSYGIPCRFPGTAGLSGFRMAFEEHYSDSQVALDTTVRINTRFPPWRRHLRRNDA